MTTLVHEQRHRPDRPAGTLPLRAASRLADDGPARATLPGDRAGETDDLAVLSAHGRSFRLAGRLLGRDQFAGATALYAACRAADDLADESPDPDLARAALLAVHRDLTGQGGPTPLGERFRRLGVEQDVAALLVRTMLSDLEPVRIADEAELLRYADGVAGTVGLMMCDVLGIADADARRHARALGVAMQLTNIARDVREDAARDRLYLPADWLPSGIGPATINRHPVPVFDAVRRLLLLADRHYEGGALGYPALPGRARLAIPVAAALYQHIGRRILRAGPGFLHHPRIVVPALTRARLVAATVAVQMAGPRNRA